MIALGLCRYGIPITHPAAAAGAPSIIKGFLIVASRICAQFQSRVQC